MQQISVGQKALIAALVICLLLLQYTFWAGDKGMVELYHLNQQIEATQAQNMELRERNNALHTEVVDLKEGSEAIEARARSELGLIKRDETFYQIIEPENDPPE